MKTKPRSELGCDDLNHSLLQYLEIGLAEIRIVSKSRNLRSKNSANLGLKITGKVFIQYGERQARFITVLTSCIMWYFSITWSEILLR